MGVQELYELDFFEWTQRNAELLRQGCLEAADIPHIAEELADMGERDRREVRSYLRRLMMHLMKWQFQPDRRTTSWSASIADSRAELEDIFEQSPSLRRLAAESFGQIYPRARRQASVETGLPQSAFPTECPYSFDQLMDDDFLPPDETRVPKES
jgi:Domain of unknown function DUF29